MPLKPYVAPDYYVRQHRSWIWNGYITIVPISQPLVNAWVENISGGYRTSHAPTDLPIGLRFKYTRTHDDQWTKGLWRYPGVDEEISSSGSGLWSVRGGDSSAPNIPGWYVKNSFDVRIGAVGVPKNPIFYNQGPYPASSLSETTFMFRHRRNMPVLFDINYGAQHFNKFEVHTDQLGINCPEGTLINPYYEYGTVDPDGTEYSDSGVSPYPDDPLIDTSEFSGYHNHSVKKRQVSKLLFKNYNIGSAWDKIIAPYIEENPGPYLDSIFVSDYMSGGKRYLTLTANGNNEAADIALLLRSSINAKTESIPEYDPSVGYVTPSDKTLYGGVHEIGTKEVSWDHSISHDFFSESYLYTIRKTLNPGESVTPTRNYFATPNASLSNWKRP